MAKTKTIHSPANFNPSDYTVEDYLDNAPPEPYQFAATRNDASTHGAFDDYYSDMQATLGPDWHDKLNRCCHCGNTRVRFVTLVKHLPTGEHVIFGADCTHRLGFAGRDDFKLGMLKRSAAAKAASVRTYRAGVAFAEAHPAVQAMLAVINEPVHAKNSFAKDVISKLYRYGSLSERQIEGVTASLARDIEFAAKKAVDDAEVKGDAPSGRVAVTGVVLSLKMQESDFGNTLKMLLKLENNSRVWLSAPRGLGAANGGYAEHGEGFDRDSTITVKATFTVSGSDKHFAFGKRPVLVSIAA